METKVNHALVGAFVLVLGAVLVIAALWLASGGALQQKYDLYLAVEDESVAGLNLNAPVKFSGVDVGKVHEIHLDPANPERVRLIFAIERGTPIKEDTEAVLKTQGLTGIAYVELVGGSPDSPPLRPASEGAMPLIRTKPSLSARLENVLTSVLAKLDRTSVNIDAVLSDANRAALSNTLADFATITHTIAARNATIDAGLANAARTFDNAAQLTAQLGPLVEQVGRSADAVRKMGDEAALASTTAARRVDAVGVDLQRFTSEALPQTQRLLGEMTALSASLRRVSDQTARDPAGLLFGRSPVPDGPGETTVEASRR